LRIHRRRFRLYRLDRVAASLRAQTDAPLCDQRQRTVTIDAEFLTGGDDATQLVKLDERETDVREQYETEILPRSVFTAGLTELEKVRTSLRQPLSIEARRITRDEFADAYRGVVARRRGVLTRCENAATALEGLRDFSRAVASSFN